MIVRIASEGQFELPGSDAAVLNELDNQAVAAVEAGDQAGFHRTYDEMIDLVHRHGTALGGDDLHESDVILPPRDLTFAEAKDGFSGEGLIPEFHFEES